MGNTPSTMLHKQMEVEHMTLSFNNDSNINKALGEGEIVYPLIHTHVQGINLHIMVDSGAASSHILSETVDAIKGVRIKRDNPLQIIGFGNKRSNLITHYSPIQLTGRDGKTISVNFYVFNKTLISELLGVSFQIYDLFPS